MCNRDHYAKDAIEVTLYPFKFYPLLYVVELLLNFIIQISENPGGTEQLVRYAQLQARRSKREIAKCQIIDRYVKKLHI